MQNKSNITISETIQNLRFILFSLLNRLKINVYMNFGTCWTQDSKWVFSAAYYNVIDIMRLATTSETWQMYPYTKSPRHFCIAPLREYVNWVVITKISWIILECFGEMQGQSVWPNSHHSQTRIFLTKVSLDGSGQGHQKKRRFEDAPSLRETIAHPEAEWHLEEHCSSSKIGLLYYAAHLSAWLPLVGIVDELCCDRRLGTLLRCDRGAEYSRAIWEMIP